MSELRVIVKKVSELPPQDRRDVFVWAIRVLAGVELDELSFAYPGLKREIGPLFILERALQQGSYLWYPLRQLYDDMPEASEIADVQRERTVRMLGTIIARLVRSLRDS